MPKAAITNDFVFGSEEEASHIVEDEDGVFDNGVSKESSTYLRPSVGSVHTTYVSADTPTEERRRMIIRVTLFAVICVPGIVLAYPGVESYVLLSIMAFTFATNFAITLMSANLEEKATSLELKTDTLLDELNSAASTLRAFQISLEQIDLEQLKENVDSARRDLEPLMQRISNPSLERIVSNVESLIDYVEDVDLEKVDKILQNYKKGTDVPSIVQVDTDDEWELLEEYPDEILNPMDDNFYPIETVRIDAEDDVFFP